MGQMKWVWLNDRLVEADKACLGVDERGLLYSDGLFETCRISGARPVFLRQHQNRLGDSAGFLGIPMAQLDLEDAIKTLALENGLEEGAARITLTRGRLPTGPRPTAPRQKGHPSPTLLITTRGLPANYEVAVSAGMSMASLPWPLRARGLPLQGHKTLAYLSSVLALGAVHEDQEPLIETTEGHLCEGATTNLFWTDGDELFTPGEETGCLPGVARALVMELARGEGLEVVEGEFDRQELINCDEAFLTNAVYGVAPLCSLDMHTLGEGVAGPVTLRLRAAYLRAMGRDLERRGVR